MKQSESIDKQQTQVLRNESVLDVQLDFAPDHNERVLHLSMHFFSFFCMVDDGLDRASTKERKLREQLEI